MNNKSVLKMHITKGDIVVDINVYKKKIICWETLKQVESYVFSFTGEIKDYCYGQVQNEILIKAKNNKERDYFIDIVYLWEKYHLNDLKAGTKVQEKLVHSYFETINEPYSYEEACRYLKSINLLTHKGYTYGTKWLGMPVYEEEFKQISKILSKYY